MDELQQKTNVVRHLESAGIGFELLSYPVDEADLSAVHAAQSIGIDPEQVFKTIVLVGERRGAFVCVVPGPYEVDLKKAAKAAGDKAASPLPLKELEPLTGYRRGGCSPIGMRRSLPTFLDETALLFERISVSAGRRGLQIFLAPADLATACGAVFADLI